MGSCRFSKYIRIKDTKGYYKDIYPLESKGYKDNSLKGISFILYPLSFFLFFCGFLKVERHNGAPAFIESKNPLYRAVYWQEYHTFEDYCKERWGMSRFYAYRVIDAAKVTENLLTIGNLQSSTIVELLPATESQARPLASLEPKEQVEVWQRAIEITNVKESKTAELSGAGRAKQANNSGKVVIIGCGKVNYQDRRIAKSENQQKKHNSKVIYGVESALIFLPCIRFLTDKTRQGAKRACTKSDAIFNSGDCTRSFVTGLHIGGIA